MDFELENLANEAYIFLTDQENVELFFYRGRLFCVNLVKGQISSEPSLVCVTSNTS